MNKLVNPLELVPNVLDYLYDAVLVVNENNEVVYINKAYSKLTGIEKETIIGKQLHLFSPLTKMLEVLETKSPQIGIVFVQNNKRWVSNIVPLIFKDKVVGGISISNDLTDYLNISEKLEQNERDLATLNETIESLKFTRFTFKDIITNNPKTLELINKAKKIAKSDLPVLILGESGTGKELFAQSIHNYSNRYNKPFIPVNCSAISPNLLESELFGYEAGSFTGGLKKGKIGLIEAANNGTLFLDEIGEMNVELQSKLLRIIETNRIRRIGSNEEKEINIRIISATNKDLNESIKNNGFRLDLFYRISTTILELIPLSENRADIVLLANYFLSIENRKHNSDIRFSQNAINCLTKYMWPGNTRELKNAVMAAYTLTDSNMIEIDDLPKIITKKNSSIEENVALTELTSNFEKLTIQSLINKYGNDLNAKKKVAKQLGISLATLYNKINR